MKKIITLLLSLSLLTLALVSCGSGSGSSSAVVGTTSPAPLTQTDIQAQYDACAGLLKTIAAGTDVDANGANASLVGNNAMALTEGNADPVAVYIYDLGNIVYLSSEYYNGGENGSTTYDDAVAKYKIDFAALSDAQKTDMPLIEDKVFADVKTNMIKSFNDAVIAQQ